MKSRIGASVHVDPSEIRHDRAVTAGVLTFGEYPSVQRLDLYFEDADAIDKTIAELVALRAEMTGDTCTSVTEPAGNGGALIDTGSEAAVADIAGEDTCECSHPQELHADTVRTPCLRPACGCTVFRLARPKREPGVPAVVRGSVEHERQAVTA